MVPRPALDAERPSPSQSASGSTEPRPGVSVVIPAFNYASFLPHAVNSVLAQSYSPLEVVIVDDGSTDATRETVEQYADDPRVRYVWQSNAGLSAARNTGIREARFPFIGLLDADDRWGTEFLQEVMGQFRSLPDTFSIVATAHHRIDNEGHKLESPKVDNIRDGELTARNFILRNRPLSSSVVIRAAAFRECGGFDPSLRSSEDRDMWIRLTAAGHRFWFINRPLASIRRHEGNMSKHADRMKRNSRAVMLNAWRRASVPRRDVAFWLRAFSVHFVQIAWTHFDAGQRLRAIRYLLTSVLLYPFFSKPISISEPPLFRLRALAHFSIRLLGPR